MFGIRFGWNGLEIYLFFSRDSFIVVSFRGWEVGKDIDGFIRDFRSSDDCNWGFYFKCIVRGLVRFIVLIRYD